jgi:hypothetical protein
MRLYVSTNIKRRGLFLKPERDLDANDECGFFVCAHVTRVHGIISTAEKVIEQRKLVKYIEWRKATPEITALFHTACSAGARQGVYLST